MKALFFALLLVPAVSFAKAETKAAIFDSTTGYLEFIEEHPSIHVVAVTNIPMSEVAASIDHRAPTSARGTQIIVTYEENK
jgi:hypothetical protein